MTGSTGRESDKFMLRLPEGMRERIKASAERAGRSMNAEIVRVLEQRWPPRRRPTGPMAEVAAAILRAPPGFEREARLAAANLKFEADPERYPWRFALAEGDEGGDGIALVFPPTYSVRPGARVYRLSDFEEPSAGASSDEVQDPSP